MKGRVIVDFERDEEEEKCSYSLKQVGNDTLDDEDIISLFKLIISELMAEENWFHSSQLSCSQDSSG